MRRLRVMVHDCYSHMLTSGNEWNVTDIFVSIKYPAFVGNGTLHLALACSVLRKTLYCA